MDRRRFLKIAAAVILLPSVRARLFEDEVPMVATDGLPVKVYLDGKLLAAGASERVLQFAVPDDGVWHHLIAVTGEQSRGTWFKGCCQDARDLLRVREVPQDARVRGSIDSWFEVREPLSADHVARLYAAAA